MTVLPGQIRKLETRFPPMCAYLKCFRPASHEIIGEVDSFGYESEFYCKQHTLEEQAKLSKVDQSGHCDWCKTSQPVVKPYHDIDEGSNGPVYEVCTACREKHNKQLEEEDEHW